VLKLFGCFRLIGDVIQKSNSDFSVNSGTPRKLNSAP
jgi:hypothetical protein